MKNPKSILITGGSSGIGKALCVEYASTGRTISFCGRNPERVAEVADEIRAKGAEVNAKVLDVTDYEGMKSWIEELDRKTPLDLVIANAGIGSREDVSIHGCTMEVFDTNVNGVFNTVHPALELMRKRGRGQIAIVSSIAGYMALPWTPSYSASKAAIRYYGKALRNKYASEGIEVNVICPGWVLTPMTEPHKGTVPFFTSMEYTVRYIRKNLERNRGLIAFPPGFAWAIWWMSTFPDALQDYILRRVH